MNPVIRTQGLHVRLGERDVLVDIAFSVSEGDLLAVLGPNGSGKSTLVRALAGLVPFTGIATVAGMSPSRVPPGTIGYVPQIKGLDRSFPARAIDLVLTAELGRWPARPSSAAVDRARAALARAGAERVADRPVGSLSGGELQRVYLARAMAREPRVLILDEPESGVDAAGTADLYQQLDAYRLQPGRAVVLVTHDWDVAIHHATRVLMLRGRQIGFGPPGEALTDANVRAAFGHVGHAHAMLTGHRHDA